MTTPRPRNYTSSRKNEAYPTPSCHNYRKGWEVVERQIPACGRLGQRRKSKPLPSKTDRGQGNPSLQVDIFLVSTGSQLPRTRTRKKRVKRARRQVLDTTKGRRSFLLCFGNTMTAPDRSNSEGRDGSTEVRGVTVRRRRDKGPTWPVCGRSPEDVES